MALITNSTSMTIHHLLALCTSTATVWWSGHSSACGDSFKTFRSASRASKISDGDFAGDVAAMCKQVGVEAIPRFNGGMYYFDKSEAAGAIFETAREIMGRYDQHGLTPMARGFASDEPVVAMALAAHGIEAIDDRGTTMRTPIGIRGPLRIDVLAGYCAFDKEGMDVSPAIAHFADWRSRGFHYNREASKLYLKLVIFR